MAPSKAPPSQTMRPRTLAALAVLLAAPGRAVAVAFGAASGAAAAGAGTSASSDKHALSGGHGPPFSQSDEKFYGNDYPRDSRPRATKRFEYPYPTLQDGEDYAKDYVKDENADAGEWKAQQEYDRLRSSFGQHKKDVDAAGAKSKEAKHDYEHTEEEEEAAEQEAKKAHDSADGAKKRLEEAKKVEEAARNALGGDAGTDSEGGGAGDGTTGGAGGKSGHADASNKIAEQVKQVEKEMADLEGCKKELQKAQDKLRLLIKSSEKEIEQQNKRKRSEDAKSVTNTAAVADAAAEASEQKAQAHATELAKKAAEQKEAYEAAEKAYEERKKSLDKEKQDLAEAEDRVRRFRSSDSGTGGGVNHSGATRATAGIVLGSIRLRAVALAVLAATASVEWFP